MPKIKGVQVATVRDLANFYAAIADKHGDDVLPYFWDGMYEKNFVILRPSMGQPQVSEYHLSKDMKFVSLETFDPDPDNETGKTLTQMIDP